MFGGRYSSSCNSSKDEVTLPNPNKFNFKILHIIHGKNKLVFLKVYYPDCTTYDGIKYVVVDSTNIDWNNFNELDPHFVEGNNVIARFVPTAMGYDYAIDMIGM